MDDCDRSLLDRYTWHVTYVGQYRNTPYIGRNVIIDGKHTTKKLHREILGVTNPRQRIDHINGNTFDNRRENLRLCTGQENTRNQAIQNNPEKTSKFKGVYREKRRKHWVAQIHFDKKKKLYLGSFMSQDLAAEAYNIAAVKYFGEFARLNRIDANGQY